MEDGRSLQWIMGSLKLSKLSSFCYIEFKKVSFSEKIKKEKEFLNLTKFGMA